MLIQHTYFYTSIESMDYLFIYIVTEVHTHFWFGFLFLIVIIMLLKLLEIDAGGTSRAEKLQKNSCFKLK